MTGIGIERSSRRITRISHLCTCWSTSTVSGCCTSPSSGIQLLGLCAEGFDSTNSSDAVVGNGAWWCGVLGYHDSSYACRVSYIPTTWNNALHLTRRLLFLCVTLGLTAGPTFCVVFFDDPKSRSGAARDRDRSVCRLVRCGNLVWYCTFWMYVWQPRWEQVTQVPLRRSRRGAGA